MFNPHIRIITVYRKTQTFDCKSKSKYETEFKKEKNKKVTKNLQSKDLKSTENMLNMKIVAKIIKVLVTHMRTTGMFHRCARLIEEFFGNIFITINDNKKPAKF